MNILSQQLARHIADVPSIRTKLSDPFPRWVPVARWVEHLTGGWGVVGLISVRDNRDPEVYSSEKNKLASTRTFL